MSCVQGKEAAYEEVGAEDSLVASSVLCSSSEVAYEEVSGLAGSLF